VTPHRFARALACALAASLAAAPAARAQDAPPASGYAGKGNVVIRTSLAGASLTLGGSIALEERGSRLRIDVLSLALPGADATISAVVGTQLFPPGGFTIVYDRRDGTYTVWSAARRAFFVGGARANASGAPLPAYANPAAGAIATGADLFNAFEALRSLRTDRTFSASVELTGHTTLFGRPVTGLRYRFAEVSTSGDRSLDVHGELELADDLDAVPVEITASVAAKGLPESSLRLDLTQLAKQPVPAGDFQPPADYARANAIGDVIGGKLSF
jgi:hypothetical protein